MTMTLVISVVAFLLTPGAVAATRGYATMWSLSNSDLIGAACEYANSPVNSITDPVLPSYLRTGYHCAIGEEFGIGEHCGRCYRLTSINDDGQAGTPGSRGSAVIMVSNSGAGGTHHFDCIVDSFEVITGARTGIFDIDYEETACTDVSGVPVIMNWADQNQWYCKMMFHNIGGWGTLESVEACLGGSCRNLELFAGQTWTGCPIGSGSSIDFTLTQRSPSGQRSSVTCTCSISWPWPTGQRCECPRNFVTGGTTAETTTASSGASATTTTTSTTLAVSCSGAGADRWGPNHGGCCSGLVECTEQRPQSDPYFCADTDPNHWSSCWSTVQICRSECAAPEATSTTLVASCSGAGADRWGPNRGGCCDGLVECTEPRPQSDSYYCADTDPSHGTSCWSTVQICRSECAALEATSTTLAASCSEASQNCQNTQCCSDASLTCYEKNQWWAQCKASCTPGIDPRDAPQWQTEWSCTALTSFANTPTTTMLADLTSMAPTTTAQADLTSMAPTCSSAWQDCRSTRCCSDPAHQCYAQSQWWAACKPSCTPSNGWSCTVLTFGNGSRRLRGV